MPATLTKDQLRAKVRAVLNDANWPKMNDPKRTIKMALKEAKAMSDAIYDQLIKFYAGRGPSLGGEDTGPYG